MFCKDTKPEPAELGAVREDPKEGKPIPFEDWWAALSRGYDPDTEDVPWYDKRKALAEYAYEAGISTAKFAPFYAAEPQQASTEPRRQGITGYCIDSDHKYCTVRDCGCMCHEVASLKQSLEAQEQELRTLMWIHHGHTGIYGDDGEMQCGECAKYGCNDYRNAPISEVRKAYQMAKFALAAARALTEGR